MYQSRRRRGKTLNFYSFPYVKKSINRKRKFFFLGLLFLSSAFNEPYFVLNKLSNVYENKNE